MGGILQGREAGVACPQAPKMLRLCQIALHRALAGG